MSHRKIDVDFLDDDQYLEDEELLLVQTSKDEEGNATPVVKAPITNLNTENLPSLQQAEEKIKEAQNALRSGQTASILEKLLTQPPASIHASEVKDKYADIVLEVVQALKPADIANQLKQLNVDQIDVLMKYIYKGLALPEKFNSGILLQWHEKVVEQNGIGTIVRVYTDRKTV